MNKENLAIVIITGLSGSGKSTALAALEDEGFFCVDNLPAALLPKFLELHSQTESEINRFAFVMDLREKNFLASYRQVFDQLEELGNTLDIIFLEAEEKTLLRRYSETRRHHPLADGKSVQDGIRSEMEKLAELRRISTRVIDTSRSSIHDLKKMVQRHVQKSQVGRMMQITVVSFGFKYGLPHDTDLVMDVRFLPNPYYVPELREQDGRDPGVRDFVLDREQTQVFLEKFLGILDFCIPGYEREGKSYLTIAIGCTGGRHRSVAVAKQVQSHLARLGREVLLKHRDLEGS